MLDALSLTGEVRWIRRRSSSDSPTDLTGATPITLLSSAGPAWPAEPTDTKARGLRPQAAAALELLRSRGASFAHEIGAHCGLRPAEAHTALGELVAAGLASCDGFGGLRSLVRATDARPAQSRSLVAGRWFAITTDNDPARRESPVEEQARLLLRRYGIVCRRLLAREPEAPRWRELVGVYRRLEARGELRGGRFVNGLSGEQFALPEAVERLREVRRSPRAGHLTTISGADPLNLCGLVTAGERVRAIGSTRLVLRDGEPVAVLEGEYLRPLVDLGAEDASRVASAAVGRPRPAVLTGFVGR